MNGCVVLAWFAHQFVYAEGSGAAGDLADAIIANAYISRSKLATTLEGVVLK